MKKRGNSGGCSKSRSNSNKKFGRPWLLMWKTTGKEHAIFCLYGFQEWCPVADKLAKTAVRWRKRKTLFWKWYDTETKKKTDSHFRGQEFQALVAAESYEVGTHSPHVNNIFRVGCMSNLTVVVQEFGSMGRSGNNSDGSLLINEKDRRSAIGILDKTKKKKATLKHSLNRRGGGCTRSALGDVLDKSLSLILAKESWSYVVSTSVAQAVTSRTAETLTPKKHVASFFRWSSTWYQPEWHKRRTQIGWLWGSKKDTFWLPEVQDPLERTNTYSSGMKQFGVVSSTGF